MTISTLPDGFRFDTGSLLVNEGPTDTAAGMITGSDAPSLGTRQVLTDGQLRAVAITPPDPGPEPFQTVHATAEGVAEKLAIGAVEVAVCWTETGTRHTSRLTSGGLAVGGMSSPDYVLLVTDAVVPAPVLRAALAETWAEGWFVLLLASGATGLRPRTPGEFADALRALRVDLACRKGGAA